MGVLKSGNCFRRSISRHGGDSRNVKELQKAGMYSCSALLHLMKTINANAGRPEIDNVAPIPEEIEINNVAPAPEQIDMPAAAPVNNNIGRRLLCITVHNEMDIQELFDPLPAQITFVRPAEGMTDREYDILI
ncbi:hypothetical protein HAX54_050616 [Datura stramonium]|uniref:Uncharacterized protein n=1 Tax=Datura stramonium TaxID=4076 RepID=A0ABS8SXC5_DATST|nr:hypothetical protein [Datura stramonium]